MSNTSGVNICYYCEAGISGGTDGMGEHIQQEHLARPLAIYSCGRECGKKFATAPLRNRHEAHICKFPSLARVHNDD